MEEDHEAHRGAVSSARGAATNGVLREQQQQQVEPTSAAAPGPFTSSPPQPPPQPVPVPGSCDDQWATSSMLLSMFEQLPPQSKLGVTVHMVLYGPRSRRRLPVFEAICPSDQ